jgi:GxxExxY protein
MSCKLVKYDLKLKKIDVYYKGQNLGIYRIDLVVDKKIILELKAVSTITDIFKHQLLSYLRATNLRLGILINFGGTKVQSYRIVN